MFDASCFKIKTMSRVCPITNKKTIVGGGYSNRTRATQFNPTGKKTKKPNIQRKRIFIPELNKPVKKKKTIISELKKVIPIKKSLSRLFLIKETPFTISESKYKLINIANPTNAKINFFFINLSTLNYLNTFPH